MPSKNPAIPPLNGRVPSGSLGPSSFSMSTPSFSAAVCCMTVLNADNVHARSQRGKARSTQAWNKKGEISRKEDIKVNQKVAKWSNRSKYSKLKKH